MNKIVFLFLTSLITLAAHAAPIKTSPNGINLNIVRPTWAVDPGLFTIRKADQQIVHSFYVGSSPSQSITPAFLTGDSGFTVNSDTCGSVVTSSCTLEIKFNSAGKANGRYSSVLSVGDLDIPLNAVVGYDLPSYEVTDSMGVSVNELNMNTVFQTLHSSVDRFVTIKDKNKSSTSTLTASVSSPFTTSSSCSPSSLNSSSGCTVTVSLPGSTSPGVYSGTLTIGSVSLNLAADVQPIGNRGLTSSFILITSSGRVVTGWDFPNSSDTISGIVRFKDVNARASSSSTQSLSSTVNYTLGSSATCAASSMNSDSGCGIRIYANNSSGLGTFTASLNSSINAGSYGLSHTVVAASIVDSKFVTTSDTAQEGRVIKGDTISSSLSSKVNRLYVRNINGSTQSGTPISFSIASQSGNPAMTVTNGNCNTSTINYDYGCWFYVTLSNPNNDTGVFSGIVTIKIGDKEEIVVFEQEVN